MATRWKACYGVTPFAYQALYDRLGNAGYRIMDLSAYTDGGARRYAAIWEQSPGPAREALPALSASTYQTTFDQMKKTGYRLVRVSGYDFGGPASFAAIWEQSPGPLQEARHGMTSADYQSKFDQMKSNGYRLIDVSGYSDHGHERYAAIWEQSAGPKQVAKHGMTASDYQATFASLTAQGYRLRHVCGYFVAGATLYAAIWEQAPGPFAEARHGMTEIAFGRAHDAWVYQGFRPREISGYAVPGGVEYAAIWDSQAYDGADLSNLDGYVLGMMKKWSVPAASLAIAKDDRLVWAKAYGEADPQTHEPATVHHRFRIASLTKAITAATVMTMQRDGLLEVHDKVFGAGAVLGGLYGTQPYSGYLQAITLDELLHHTVGTWANDSNDPMFNAPGDTHEAIISWTLDNRPLSQSPGGAFAYSNFGYCVLGRVIERVTGLSYPNAVASRVFQRAGIANMEIGGDTRKAMEVVYVGQGGEDPSSVDCQRLDSHGGWIATPIDLARFLVHIDQNAVAPDILPTGLSSLMGTGSSANAGYGMGLLVNTAGNWWHNGSLPGTTTFMARIADGFSWVVLTNTRPSDGAQQNAMEGDLDQLMWNLRNAVSMWPNDLDLF